MCAGFIFSLHRLGEDLESHYKTYVKYNKMTRSASSVQGANGSKINVEQVPALKELALFLEVDGIISPVAH